jgi:hypothetical protein
MPRCAVALRSLSERHGRGMAWERYGRGMACVNQTRSHCVNQMGKTQSKPLVERHGMCELALNLHTSVILRVNWYLALRLDEEV